MTKNAATIHATQDQIRNAANALDDDQLAAIYLTASRYIGGTRFNEPADLFSETFGLMLQGTRRWPLALPFDVYLNLAMRSVAGDDRELHENCRTARSPVEEILEIMECQGAARPSALDRMLELERLEIAVDALEKAWSDSSRDQPARRVIEGWLAEMDAPEICAAFDMAEPIYDAARKRALRVIRKHVAGRLG